jgi:protein-S-isoprenylcysteine O-methyltransferase Ste14
MPIYCYIILVIGWLLWFAPFAINGWHTKSVSSQDKRARWGILLQVIAYSLLWQGKFWLNPSDSLRIALSILFFLLSALLSWTAVRALGRHLRFDAALRADHQLVQSGPYRILRHPIYTSMLCLLLATGFMVTPPLLFLIAIVIFLIGSEIRVRIEDHLLAARFGDQFYTYQHSVAAYIPFLR